MMILLNSSSASQTDLCEAGSTHDVVQLVVAENNSEARLSATQVIFQVVSPKVEIIEVEAFSGDDFRLIRLYKYFQT